MHVSFAQNTCFTLFGNQTINEDASADRRERRQQWNPHE